MRKLSSWVAGAFLALAGCGGGGGGGGPPDSTLSGDFALVEFQGRFASGPGVVSITTWGRATAGGSMLSSIVDRDDLGIPVGPETPLPFQLHDDPNSRIHFIDTLTGDYVLAR